MAYLILSGIVVLVVLVAANAVGCHGEDRSRSLASKAVDILIDIFIMFSYVFCFIFLLALAFSDINCGPGYW